MEGLSGRTAIVTGGIGDLGWASGVRLRAEGCRVALLDRKADEAGKAATIGARFYAADVSDEGEVARACAAAEKDLGPASILVNAAAIFILKGIEATAEEWAAILRVNVTGMSLMARHVVPQMKRAGRGAIVNFSSVSGFVAQPGFSTYTATKFAIRGLTRGWAMDLAPAGIRVNSICPGYIHTSAFVNSCATLGKNVEEEDRRVSSTILLGRQGRPEEVAAAVAFLASDESSYMTGSDLILDGGYLAR